MRDPTPYRPILTMRGRPVQNVGVQALLTVVFILLGLAIGSFLNVCIDRLPGGRSIVTPPSRCDQCQRRLAVADLIPVFSYLWLRGRCRYCGAVLPKRIVVVELCPGDAGALYLGFGLRRSLGSGLLGVPVHRDLCDRSGAGTGAGQDSLPIAVGALVFAGLVNDLPWLEGIGVMEEWPQIAVAALGGGVGFCCSFCWRCLL